MNLGSALSIPSVNHRLDLLARSVRFLSCGKLKRASQLIAEAANSHSDDSEDVREMIAACQRLGIIVQSRKFLSKADVLLMAGDFENAFRKYLLIGIAGLPRDISFQALHNKAVCLVRLNLFGEAIEHFQEALLRFPKDTLCLQHLAFVLMMNRDFSAALQVFGELIRIDEIKPENLLHILYGAAECRQRLNLGENTGEMADHTLHAIQQHQELHVRHHQTGYFSDDNGDDESYNDYGLAEFGEEVLQNVSHVKHIGAPAVMAVAVAPVQDRAAVQVQETSSFRPLQSQSQFRRLRYQPETKVQSRSSLSIDTGVEKPVRRGDEDGSQSPQLSVQSKQKRQALRRAVGAYDRSVLVVSPVQQGQVRASVPTLIHRERGTDPSPGHYTTTHSANRNVSVSKGGVQESPRDPERTGGGISSSQSVSSSKPKLSRHTHRRYNTHVEFAPPVLPTPPPYTEKITAKPEAIRVDVRYPDLPVETNGGADANTSTKLAPANPMAAPMFAASPLPVPRWRPQERVSTTKASSAPPRAPTPSVQASTAQPVPRPIAHLTLTSAVGVVPLAKMSPDAPPPQIAVVPPRKQHSAVQLVESAQTSEPLPDPLLGFSAPLSAPLDFSKPTSATSFRRALPPAPVPTQQLRLPTGGVAAATPLADTSTLTLSATQLEPASCASASNSVRSHSSPPLEGTPLHMVDTERVVGPEQLVARENSSGSSASSNSVDLSDYLRAAGLSPPVLSDLSSSEPPPSIKAAVQASHKPRCPSLSSMPDLDFTSQPAYIGVVVQKDISPLIDLNAPIHSSAKETHPGTAGGGTLFALHSQPSGSSGSSATAMDAVPVLQPWSSVPLVLPRDGSKVDNDGNEYRVDSGLKASAANHSNVRASCIGDGDVKSHTSSVAGASQISAISTDSSSSGYASETSSKNLTNTFRCSGTQARSQPNSSVASEQQEEMDRVFEGRRFVDNYTVTNADVMKLHAEFQRRFPSSNGPPTVTYPYAALRSPGPYPPDVDIRIREMYLSDAEFQALFHTSKTNWLSLPEWRQLSLKKSLELF